MEVILKAGIEGLILTLFGEVDESRKWTFFLEHDDFTDALFADPSEYFPNNAIMSLPANSWNEAVDLLSIYRRGWYQLRPLKMHPDFRDTILAAVQRLGGDSHFERWKSSRG